MYCDLGGILGVWSFIWTFQVEDCLLGHSCHLALFQHKVFYMSQVQEVWSQSTWAADGSAQSDRVVVVGVIDSRKGVHNVELLSWEQPGSSQCNGKCKIYLCSSRAVSLLTCSEGACSSTEETVTQLVRSSQAGGFPSAPWEFPGDQPIPWAGTHPLWSCASDGRLLGTVRVTFSCVWVQERRAPSMLITLPVKPGKLQQRRKLPYSILSGQGRIFAAWSSYSTHFQSLHWNARLCARLKFHFAETVQYGALQVRLV